MDKDQVIAVMKKNLLSILAGVVALVAIAFMLFWLNGKFVEVQQQAQARAAREGQIEGMLGQFPPNIQFTTSGAPNSLGMFPTNRAIAMGRETMDGVKAQAEQVLENARALNERVPLGFESFDQANEKWPLDGDQAAAERQSFRTAYLRRINGDNSQFNADTGDYLPGTIQAEMNATRPPSAAELETMEAGVEANLRAEMPVNEQGNPQDPAEFARRLAQEQVKFASNMKYGRAQRHLIYVDPNGAPGATGGGFTVHPLPEQPSSVDVFNAQVGLWVQETVAQNLVRANMAVVEAMPTEQQNLLNAPVKHLLSVTVPLQPFGEAAEAAPTEGAEQGAPVNRDSVRRGGGAGAGQPPPEEEGDPAEEAPAEEEAAGPVAVDPTVEIKRQFQVSASGRPLHTPFYDLVQFRVRLRCEAEEVPYVLKQLQADSFLTVLNVTMTMVDPATAAQAGYVYGNGAIVELDLACEMPFMRSWLMELMPEALQRALAQVPAETEEQPEF